jgi:Cyclin, N-terminal domain
MSQQLAPQQQQPPPPPPPSKPTNTTTTTTTTTSTTTSNSSSSRFIEFKANQEDEIKRRKTCRFIEEAGRILKLPRVAISTAEVFFHRFYAKHSFQDHDRFEVAVASIVLAAKTEEAPKKLVVVIQECYKLKARGMQAGRISSQPPPVAPTAAAPTAAVVPSSGGGGETSTSTSTSPPPPLPTTSIVVVGINIEFGSQRG